MGNRELLCDMGYEDTVVFDAPDYDDAIIGVSQDGRAVYSYEKMIDNLIREHGMTREEAVEFIEYNTIGVHFDGMPIVVFDI